MSQTQSTTSSLQYKSTIEFNRVANPQTFNHSASSINSKDAEFKRNITCIKCSKVPFLDLNEKIYQCLGAKGHISCNDCGTQAIKNNKFGCQCSGKQIQEVGEDRRHRLRDVQLVCKNVGSGCPVRFTLQHGKDLQDHEQKCKSTFVCDTCSSQFFTFHQLEEHIEAKHPEKKSMSLTDIQPVQTCQSAQPKLFESEKDHLSSIKKEDPSFHTGEMVYVEAGKPDQRNQESTKKPNIMPFVGPNVQQINGISNQDQEKDHPKEQDNQKKDEIQILQSIVGESLKLRKIDNQNSQCLKDIVEYVHIKNQEEISNYNCYIWLLYALIFILMTLITFVTIKLTIDPTNKIADSIYKNLKFVFAVINPFDN